MMFMFDDKKALGTESDHIGGEEESDVCADESTVVGSGIMRGCFGGLTVAAVPYILFTADLIGVASSFSRAHAMTPRFAHSYSFPAPGADGGALNAVVGIWNDSQVFPSFLQERRWNVPKGKTEIMTDHFVEDAAAKADDDCSVCALFVSLYTPLRQCRRSTLLCLWPSPSPLLSAHGAFSLAPFERQLAPPTFAGVVFQTPND